MTVGLGWGSSSHMIVVHKAGALSHSQDFLNPHPPSCPSHIFEHLHKVQSVLMSLRIGEIWNLEGFRMPYLKLEFDIEDEMSQVGLRYPICNDQSEKGSLPLTTSTWDQQLSIVYLFFACFCVCSFYAVAFFGHF